MFVLGGAGVLAVAMLAEAQKGPYGALWEGH